MARPRRGGMGLTPLLLSIGETAGKTGAGYQYVDTFKRQMAPELDREDSTSLMNYSQWARRNGYDEEANRYESLGLERSKIEGKQSYKKGVQGMSQALDNINNARSQISGSQDPTDLLRLDALNQAHASTVERMNALGMESEYGTGREGAEAVARSAAAQVAAEEHAMKIGEWKIKEAEANAAQMDRLAEGAEIPPELLPPHLRETYRKARATAQHGNADYIRINKQYEGLVKEWKKQKEQKAVASAAFAVEATVNSLISEGQKDWYQDDLPINDYLTDEDNEQIIADAKRLSKELLANDISFINEEDREAQKSQARKVFRETLRDLDGKFYKALGDNKAALDDETDDNARKTNTVKRNYKKGLFPGGKAYNESLELAKRISEQAGLGWTADDRTLFDSEWDEENRNRGNLDLAKSFANPGPLLSGMR